MAVGPIAKNRVQAMFRKRRARWADDAVRPYSCKLLIYSVLQLDSRLRISSMVAFIEDRCSNWGIGTICCFYALHLDA
jgi:hypothetical protein